MKKIIFPKLPFAKNVYERRKKYFSSAILSHFKWRNMLHNMCNIYISILSLYRWIEHKIASTISTTITIMAGECNTKIA